MQGRGAQAGTQKPATRPAHNPRQAAQL